MAVRFNRRVYNSIITEVRQQVVRETEAVKTEAIRLTFLPKHGNVHVYEDRIHVASAPGEPYANDTGNANSLITTKVFFDNTKIEGKINFGAEYHADLEFGTQKMEPRPTARPALENRREDAVKNIREAVNRGIRKA